MNRRKIGWSITLLLLAVGAWAGAQTLLWGDFNGNGGVDSDDLFDFAYYFGSERGEPVYETEGFNADFDQNGRVDEIDLFEFSARWHQE